MSDLIPDARELQAQGDINTLQQIFFEASRLSWSDSEVRDLYELYEIAKKEDEQDPVGWIQDFNRSHPKKLDVGDERMTRVQKILHMAKVFLDTKQAQEERKNKTIKREF